METEVKPASLWRCDVCGETLSSSTTSFPKGEAWHAHTDTYSRIGSSGTAVDTITEAEWRSARNADALLSSPLMVVVVALAALAVICPILHYRKLDREYGDTLSPAKKVAATAVAFAAACAAGALFGSLFGRKSPPKDG